MNLEVLLDNKFNTLAGLAAFFGLATRIYDIKKDLLGISYVYDSYIIGAIYIGPSVCKNIIVLELCRNLSLSGVHDKKNCLLSVHVE